MLSWIRTNYPCLITCRAELKLYFLLYFFIPLKYKVLELSHNHNPDFQFVDNTLQVSEFNKISF